MDTREAQFTTVTDTMKETKVMHEEWQGFWLCTLNMKSSVLKNYLADLSYFSVHSFHSFMYMAYS